MMSVEIGGGGLASGLPPTRPPSPTHIPRWRFGALAPSASPSPLLDVHFMTSTLSDGEGKRRGQAPQIASVVCEWGKVDGWGTNHLQSHPPSHLNTHHKPLQVGGQAGGAGALTRHRAEGVGHRDLKLKDV